MSKLIVSALAAFAIAGSASAATNLVQNGSFEQNNLTADQKLDLASRGRVGVEIDSHFHFADAVTGWSSPSTGNDYALYFFDGDTAKLGDADTRYPSEEQRPNKNFTGDSPDGGAFIVLDADPDFNGNIQQMVTGLTVGKSYNLQFYWAGGELSNRTGYKTSQLTGKFGTDSFATEVFNNSHPFDGPTGHEAGDFSGWRLKSFNFTAKTSSQLLSFLAEGTPRGNLPPVAFLDGVSLTAVPEPQTWALMLMGFGGLGAAIRHRRKLAATA